MTTLSVKSPYDGELIETMELVDEPSAMAKLALVHATYLDRDNWLKPYQRIVILERTALLIQERRDELAGIVAREGGKPVADARVELERAALGIKMAIAQLQTMGGTEVPMNLSTSSQQRMAYTYREPVGVVLAISAFNHPFNLIVHQVVAAVAAGCPVLVKPSMRTPLSCLNLVDILYASGLPEAWCQTVVCDTTVTEHLASDSRIGFLTFIGSSKVGWYLRSKLAAGALCALEHGGAAPVIVEADAELVEAIPLLVKGGFYHAGQVCTSVQRIFVQQKIAKAFQKQFVDKVTHLQVGDPQQEDTDVGPLILKRELQRVDNWVQQAVANGAKLLCGGKPLSDSCYQPTVLLDPPVDVHVSREEIFGPVVCLYTYKDRAQAIARANSLPFIFQAAVFTQNLDGALDTVKRLNAKTVLVNDSTTFRTDWMPFGGRAHSGLGTGGIPYTMRDMTYEKMMVVHSAVL